MPSAWKSVSVFGPRGLLSAAGLGLGPGGSEPSQASEGLSVGKVGVFPPRICSSEDVQLRDMSLDRQLPVATSGRRLSHVFNGGKPFQGEENGPLDLV